MPNDDPNKNNPVDSHASLNEVLNKEDEAFIISNNKNKDKYNILSITSSNKDDKEEAYNNIKNNSGSI